jgi:hypothetical protein
MDDTGHRLRGRELPRLLGRWLVAGVLPSWAVLTALSFEWGAAPDDGGLVRLGSALGTSTSILVLLLLLAVPAAAVAPLLRRPRRSGLDAEDLQLLAAEIAGAPVRVTVLAGPATPVEPPRPRVPVRAPEPTATAEAPPVAPPTEPAPGASRGRDDDGNDDVDALFR